MRTSPICTPVIAVALMLALGGASSAVAQEPPDQTDLKLQALDEERPPSAPSDTRGDHARFAAFVQVAGSAMALGVGIDCRPLPELALRAGLATMAIPGFGVFGAGGFFGASGVFGPRSHKFELGLDYIRFANDEDLRFYSPLAGYRYQPESGGVFARISAQALVRVNFEVDVFPTAGVSVGFTQ